MRTLRNLTIALLAAAYLIPDMHAQTKSNTPDQVGTPIDYRTAWPKQGPVLRPDPVTGEEKFWEYWVYSEAFSKRFQGFDTAQVSRELTPGVLAIAFRTYREKVFDTVPPLFRCEYEIYFDSGVRIPLGDRNASVVSYPPGVTIGLHRLRPAQRSDATLLVAPRQELKAVASLPLMISDGQLDGRYARFGLAWYPDVLPGLSMAVLGRGGTSCEVMAPKRPSQRYWIALFGELSFNPAAADTPFLYSREFRQWLSSGTFDPRPEELALERGRIAIPEAFYEALLPKVTLVKAVNQCIQYRDSYAQGYFKDVGGSKARHLEACNQVDQQGRIFDFISSPNTILEGWHRAGF